MALPMLVPERLYVVHGEKLPGSAFTKSSGVLRLRRIREFEKRNQKLYEAQQNGCTRAMPQLVRALVVSLTIYAQGESVCFKNCCLSSHQHDNMIT